MSVDNEIILQSSKCHFRFSSPPSCPSITLCPPAWGAGQREAYSIDPLLLYHHFKHAHIPPPPPPPPTATCSTDCRANFKKLEFAESNALLN